MNMRKRRVERPGAFFTLAGVFLLYLGTEYFVKAVEAWQEMVYKDGYE